MNTLFEKKLQTLLNRYMGLDPETKQRLKALDGKNVMIKLDALHGIPMQLHFTKDGIELNTSNRYPSDTIIKGKPLSLFHLSLIPHRQRKKFFEEDIHIEGNIEVGEKVLALFDELEIDWEEYLSHWVGDIPAHHIGNFVRKAKKFSRKLQDTLSQNINEYVHEEIRLCPPREELEDFFHDVDTLRMDIDRLEARFLLLTHAIENKEE